MGCKGGQNDKESVEKKGVENKIKMLPISSRWLLRGGVEVTARHLKWWQCSCCGKTRYARGLPAKAG